jgi:hypothetical protein
MAASSFTGAKADTRLIGLVIDPSGGNTLSAASEPLGCAAGIR